MIATLGIVAKQLRLYQWVKNILVVLPLLLAHAIGDADRWLQVATAFLCFSLCASTVYVLNDIIDAEADRNHPRKRHRPIASGQLSTAVGIVLAVVCISGAAFLAVQLPVHFMLWMAVYLVATTAYSFVLKKLVIVDVLVLAGLYSTRVLAGGAASDIVVSPWLLMLMLFLSTSLAFVKRYTELASMPLTSSGVMRRGYRREDVELIRVIGPVTGLLAVVVLAFYIAGPDVQQIYRQPQWLWLSIPLVMYWIIDLWLQAVRGLVHDDPILHMVRDARGWVVGALLFVVAALAT